MRLKNKKTGEIKNAVDIDMYTDSVYLKVSNGEFDNETIEYHSLAELNEQWEDVPEEPKEYYAIDLQGDIIRWARHSWDEETTNKIKEIGNYFETEEEAEKAVKKLRAFKRLKDLGTEILGWEIRDMPTGGDWQTVNVKLNIKARKEPMELLDLLFEGEE